VIEALGRVLDPGVLLVVVLSALYGVLVGAIPGLTATMAVALIVPLTFHLDPVHAIAAVVTLVACAIFAGDIPAALVRMPGTPASAAYTDDLHALAKRGQQDRVLGLCLVSSVVGGLLGSILLMLLAQSLARVTALFGTVEYFWLYLLGLGCGVVATRGSPLRGALGLVVGLGLSTVGLSTAHGTERLTFGLEELYRGVSFIPAMIGLFGLSEVLRNLLAPRGTGEAGSPAGQGEEPGVRGALRSVFGLAIPTLRRRRAATVRSAGIGALVGMLPGAGADIAAWVSLGVSRRLQGKRSRAGAETAGGRDADLEGVADATAANNAALAGAWVPTLVLGIPGDSVTAVVIGILMMKDVTPGPALFAEGGLAHEIYLLFLLANLVLLPVGFLAIRAGRAIVRVPHRVLLPVIVLFCVVGAYSVDGSLFDVGVMLVLGLLGLALERRQVPLGPVVLGIVLGGPLEERLIGTLATSGGSLLAFIARPQSLVLAVFCAALWLSPLVAARRRGRA
jgi:putative tricarboxylic transport membrane protein